MIGQGGGCGFVMDGMGEGVGCIFNWGGSCCPMVDLPLYWYWFWFLLGQGGGWN
jgi:hypothetical protein